MILIWRHFFKFSFLVQFMRDLQVPLAEISGNTSLPSAKGTPTPVLHFGGLFVGRPLVRNADQNTTVPALAVWTQDLRTVRRRRGCHMTLQDNPSVLAIVLGAVGVSVKRAYPIQQLPLQVVTSPLVWLVQHHTPAIALVNDQKAIAED